MKDLVAIFILIFAPISIFGQKAADTDKYPYFLVSKLKMKIGSAIYHGTGFIFKDSFLITNAHNVYNKDSLIVIPALSPSTSPYGEIRMACKKGINVFIPEEFDDDHISESYDFAVVKLPASETLKKLSEKTNPLEISIDSLKEGEDVNIAGYPVFHWFEFKKSSGKIQLENSSRKYSVSEEGHLINYRMNARGGSSGSPLWVHRDGKIYLVGIHKSGSGRHNQGILYSTRKREIIEGFLK